MECGILPANCRESTTAVSTDAFLEKSRLDLRKQDGLGSLLFGGNRAHGGNGNPTTTLKRGPRAAASSGRRTESGPSMPASGRESR
jgi:hypothetical protein